MITLRNLKVFSLSLDWYDLTWEIEPTTEDVWSYRFVVERSESPEGPWDTVSGEFTDTYRFRDAMVNLRHRYRKYYYRIRTYHVSAPNSPTYSEVAYQSAKPDLIAMEVRRLEAVLFREHIGRRCWVFPRRTFGQRCPECYDEVTAQQLKDGCRTCYDTTFVRGFLDPIESVIQFDPNPRHIENLQILETHQENVTARCLYYPELKPRDVIVEAENMRWRVVRVSLTQRLRATLHQELVLHGIPHTDIEWQLPINLADLSSFEASPLREFTNPTNLEAAKDYFYGADTAVYGHRRN